MQLFFVIFLCPLCRNSFRAKKKLKKSVKKFGLYSFLYYICSIRKIKKVITIKNINYGNCKNNNKQKLQRSKSLLRNFK